MRSFALLLFICLGVSLVPVSCVDPLDLSLRATVNVVVVDGTITNLTEPQIIRLNRSRADPLTGRFSTTPLAKAQVAVVVDSTAVIAFYETEAGRYQAPDGFVGQVGHRHQLRFTLSDGTTHYESDQQTMQAVPPITTVRARFNPNSLSPAQQLTGGYAAAHDFYVDFTDPIDQRNYYRWDWIDWERQEWCRSCNGGLYQINDAKGNLIEDCMNNQFTYPSYDYNCRTTCWEIVYGNDLRVFSDQNTNGNPIAGYRVAQVPLYSKERCLVEIRQNSLTPSAYSYFKTLSDQTQRTGGLADTPPAAPIGNVRNRANPVEVVAGYFTTSAVTSQRY